jgi:signal transduction histidine kinase/ActR/RegA family two-component response regulator
MFKLGVIQFFEFGGQGLALRNRQRLQATLLVVGFLTTALIGLSVVKYPTAAPADWMATSFLVCLIVMSRGPVRAVAVAACAVGLLAIARASHWGWFQAGILTVFTVAEALLAVWLMRRLSKTPRLANIKQAAKLIAFVILPTTLLSSLAAGVACELIYGKGFATLASQWFAGHATGMVIALPALLILATPTLIKPPTKSPFEKIFFAAVLAMFATSPFTPFGAVAFMLILPAATIFAFRLGLKTTVVSILAIDGISEFFAYLHPNPDIWGVPMSMEMSILLGQIYYLAVYLNGLFTGLAIDYQARLKLLLERKSEIARQARTKAFRASRAKTEFLATMSHEIRTPLNGVIGFTQVLLKRDSLAREDREQVELISASGHALLTVVNDILDFSKVEAGEVTLNPRPVRLAAVVEDVAAIIRLDAERKDLKLTVNLAGDTEAFHDIDDQRLKQVLFNLLNNAVKFTNRGGVALSVDWSGQTVRFDVQDTGPGIAADAIPRLFHRFSQADSSISREHGGTGLGLAISKGLVELMGGVIGVHSTPGEGARFWFEVSPPQVAEGPRAQVSEDGGEGASAHVLLVDDHPVNRQLGVTILNLLGCTVDTADNGQEALDAVKSRRYDLVLMDVHMPVMDGLEATRAIRALDHAHASVPIISMSADVLSDQVARCTAAGMNDRVSKPIDIDALQACLNRWVGRDSTGEAIAA